jgi:hypothetical protein
VPAVTAALAVSAAAALAARCAAQRDGRSDGGSTRRMRPGTRARTQRQGARSAWLWDPEMLVEKALVVAMIALPSIDFDLLYERSQIVALATTNVRIASIEDLIQLKRLANRPEDQRDIEALQTIRRSKRDA